jgi:hypothetical protein
MGVVVNVDKSLIDKAKTYSAVEHRSVPKQIEHWAKIGRIAEENKELTYDAIKGILLGLADVEAGNIEEYKDNSF